MSNFLMKIISVFSLVALLALPAPAADQHWLWVSTKEQVRARHLTLDVTPVPGDPSRRLAQFECAIASDFSYPGATVHLEARNDRGETVREGHLPLDIDAGANTCTISLDTSELPLGNYEAAFSIAHPSLLSEPIHTFSLRNVSVADLSTRLGESAERAGAISQALDALEGEARTFPYLRLRLNLIDDVLARARENESLEAWESLESELRYVERGLDAVHAGIVFSESGTERSAGVDVPRDQDLHVQNGGFYLGSKPVFLFGGVLPEVRGDALAQLKRYQLNAATTTLIPSSNPAEPNTVASLSEAMGPLFEAAESNGVNIAIQLAPDGLAVTDPAFAPGLAENQRGDIAEEAARSRWTAYLAAVGPLLRDRSRLVGVSLAQDPYFHFDGPATKAGFLDFIRANYQDRITLNRAWRSHLATLDDIELWSENPYDNYQQHRSFLFDWQTYHQQLGNAYFVWSRDAARQLLPQAELMVTLSDTPFAPGESKYGVNREVLAESTDVIACTGTNLYADPVYAMGYPHQSAHYTLLRSLAPGQPVFNMNSTWVLPEHGTARDTYRFVHSALWEGVMSGLNGATIPMDSLVFQRPEALEAFAIAALDINRLAAVVMAFQQAPTDVGILYSESSKVFDNGVPHLKSALHAFEGASFGGYNVRFITERQCNDGILETLKVVVIPDTPAVSDDTFHRLSDYVEAGGTIARTGAPIPYNERGFSRDDLIRNTGTTVLVRGLNLPTEYLHAMDAATVLGTLPQIPRMVTPQGYPIEGVKSRHVVFEGDSYLYVVNMRKEPAYCTLASQNRSGRDLIQGEDVTFPTTIEPLVPMLIKLDPAALEMTVTSNSTLEENQR